MSKKRSKKTLKHRHLPVGRGDFTVGCADVMTDCSESGSFFRLYYPVEKTDIRESELQWPRWLPKKQYRDGYIYFLNKNSRFHRKLFNWIGGSVFVPALWHAPILQGNSKCPVIIFSHGMGGNRTTYSTICCELASHGFVVAAVEHRDGSASATYYLKMKQDFSANASEESLFQEEWKWFEQFQIWDDFHIRNKQVYQRTEECQKALDVLTKINEGQDISSNIKEHFFDTRPFESQLDLSKVAIVGHSFGGATVLTTLSKDRRFRVGVCFDSWMHPLDDQVYGAISQPVLMINSETFHWKKNITHMQKLQSMKPDKYIITIRGTCHQSVTDFQFLMNMLLGRLLKVRYTLPPKVALSLNSQATIGFLWKHLGFSAKELHEDMLSGEHNQVLVGTNVDLS